jgi:Ca-activated chloride channel family protein
VYSVSANCTRVTCSGSLSVSWTAPSGRPSSDWIGLFKVGDPNTLYAWWNYSGGSASGTLNLNAPTQAGSYEFRYLLAGGHTDAARSAPIQVETPAVTYSLTPSATSVSAGGALSVSWTAPSGRPASDWIGLFKSGSPNTAYGWWKYTQGAQSGVMNLNAPTEPGIYEFRYLLNNGYTDSARSSAVTVSQVASNYSVAADRSSVAPGGSLTVSWTAPAGRPYNDWVGIFRVGDPSTSYGWWKYTNGATSGSFTMTAPVAPGQYEFRYLLQNGFTDSARSSSITVGS